jgi:hypothetical protein
LGLAGGDTGFGGGSAFGSWGGILGVGGEGGGDDEGQGEGADHGVSGWMGDGTRGVRGLLPVSCAGGQGKGGLCR